MDLKTKEEVYLLFKGTDVYSRIIDSMSWIVKPIVISLLLYYLFYRIGICFRIFAKDNSEKLLVVYWLLATYVLSFTGIKFHIFLSLFNLISSSTIVYTVLGFAFLVLFMMLVLKFYKKGFAITCYYITCILTLPFYFLIFFACFSPWVFVTTTILGILAIFYFVRRFYYPINTVCKDLGANVFSKILDGNLSKLFEIFCNLSLEFFIVFAGCSAILMSTNLSSLNCFIVGFFLIWTFLIYLNICKGVFASCFYLRAQNEAFTEHSLRSVHQEFPILCHIAFYTLAEFIIIYVLASGALRISAFLSALYFGTQNEFYEPKSWFKWCIFSFCLTLKGFSGYLTNFKLNFTDFFIPYLCIKRGEILTKKAKLSEAEEAEKAKLVNQIADLERMCKFTNENTELAKKVVDLDESNRFLDFYFSTFSLALKQLWMLPVIGSFYLFISTVFYSLSFIAHHSEESPSFFWNFYICRWVDVFFHEYTSACILSVFFSFIFYALVSSLLSFIYVKAYEDNMCKKNNDNLSIAQENSLDQDQESSDEVKQDNSHKPSKETVSSD